MDKGNSVVTREAVVKDRADWLLDAVATATQDRRFLRGDPEYDEVAGGAILRNGEKAIRTAIDRIASTTTAQATIDELRGALIRCGRAAGAVLSDEVSNEFLMLVPAEVEAKIAILARTGDA